MKKGRVAICTPTWERPTDAYLQALEASVPALDAAGWEHHAAFEVTNPYISAARASMLGKALAWGADVIVFIDDDVSWQPEDLIKLLDAKGDVVGGNYRYKTDDELRFMGKPFLGDRGHPLFRESDDAVLMLALPAGFLKITRAGVMRFLKAYPDLRMNTEKPEDVNVDLFNHGVKNGTWFGEDFAFCRNWLEIGGDILCVPDLDLVHNSRGYWAKDGYHAGKAYPSNYLQYLKTYRPPAEEKKAA
jgi:glycosyltransferase involved in cell wall biosynthesis